MNQRRETFRSLKLLKQADGAPCIQCGRQDGTTVPAHYFGPMRFRLHGGMASKVTDAATAHLCYDCHVAFDQYKGGNTTERSESFLCAIVLTWDWRCSNGLMVPK